jgi:hypothetical protein
VGFRGALVAWRFFIKKILAEWGHIVTRFGAGFFFSPAALGQIERGSPSVLSLAPRFWDKLNAVRRRVFFSPATSGRIVLLLTRIGVCFFFGFAVCGHISCATRFGVGFFVSPLAWFWRHIVTRLGVGFFFSRGAAFGEESYAFVTRFDVVLFFFLVPRCGNKFIAIRRRFFI